MPEASMDFVESILKASRVPYLEYRCNSPLTIWLTSGNQLMSSHKGLSRFATVDPHYRGWHAHHVVEAQDLERLGVGAKFPAYEEQLTVLLPHAAHIRRVNSVLRNQAPKYAVMPIADLLAAYAGAYALMGNYCGGGEQRIQGELMAVARAILRWAGLV
jgi:hypothetical protein